MQNQHYRYFIELQPRDGAYVPRARESEVRRETAHDFILTMRNWLDARDLGKKVSEIGVTMFGQIQITCEAGVINLIRHQDTLDIAAIRQGAMYTENPGRRSGTR